MKDKITAHDEIDKLFTKAHKIASKNKILLIGATMTKDKQILTVSYYDWEFYFQVMGRLFLDHYLKQNNLKLVPDDREEK